VALAIAVASAEPAQRTDAEGTATATWRADGEPIFTVADAVQPWASVTVMVYDPAVRPVAVAEVRPLAEASTCPQVQEYV